MSKIDRPIRSNVPNADMNQKLPTHEISYKSYYQGHSVFIQLSNFFLHRISIRKG